MLFGLLGTIRISRTTEITTRHCYMIERVEFCNLKLPITLYMWNTELVEQKELYNLLVNLHFDIQVCLAAYVIQLKC